jgi:oligopeptide/dipeptide ABC transporter ATP-binding protein
MEPGMSLLTVRNLSVSYDTPAGTVRAVRNVNFDIAPGETVGLVGESGCGKSTLAKAIMRLTPVANGSIMVQGRDITRLSARELRPLRREVQMIFQDPYGALNPRHSVGQIIGQPLSLAGYSKAEVRERVAALLAQVGLPGNAAQRFPHEFSGGQRQRIGIARALALEPKLLICDEPVSALDVSVRAQIINLLMDLQDKLGISYLFVSHDLSVVQHICDRVLVMYLGRVVESGGIDAVWQHPAHPYSSALLDAAPVADPRARQLRSHALLQGELPNPLNPPAGCAFSSRCPHAHERCTREDPPLRSLPFGRQVACHLDFSPQATLDQRAPLALCNA